MYIVFVVFFNDTASPEIYTYCHTLSLHDALPIYVVAARDQRQRTEIVTARLQPDLAIERPVAQEADGRFALQDELAIGLKDRRTETVEAARSEEHTSELQSLMRISYAVFCLQNKKDDNTS